MSFSKIALEMRSDGQIAHILLNSPKANIVDRETVGEIKTAWLQAWNTPSVKLVVFEGNGDHFSFGASVAEHTMDQIKEMLAGFHSMFKLMAEKSIPSVALVRGQCLGGGMELAISCDWILAHPTAKFGQPEIMLGVLPPVASILLPRLIGQAKANFFNLTGASVAAETAHEWGLVQAVSENLDAELEGITAQLFRHSASSLRLAKEASNLEWNRAVLTQIDQAEAIYLEKLNNTHDGVEGIRAFLEKRKPEWKNC